MRHFIGSIVSALVVLGCGSSDGDDIREPTPLDPSTQPGPPVGFGDVPPAPLAAASAPPPISGGTLHVSRSGRVAVAADPDRDKLYLVDLDKRTLTASFALQPGDEPGRIAEDKSARAFVVLRGAGAIVGVNLATKSLIERRSVCAAPRGIAYHEGAQLLYVACEDGQLVSMNPDSDTVVRRVQLPRDLRDVVVDGERVLVTRFRSAEVLVVGPNGGVERTVRPAPAAMFAERITTPKVAWRAIAVPGGGAALIHQRASVAPVVLEEPSGYGSGGPCGSISESTISVVGSHAVEQLPAGATLATSVLPVDLAVSPDGSRFAYVAAGNNWNSRMLASVFVTPNQSPVPDFVPCDASQQWVQTSGEPTAVAFDGQGDLVIQSREPAQLQLDDGTIVPLDDESRFDSGLALFHMDSAGGIACASCHPEGQDDGHVWSFDPIGPRRTQNFSGGFLNTAPFHWDGDMADLRALVHDVFSRRMGGGVVDDTQLAVFAQWIDQIPNVPTGASTNGEAAERGRALFESEEVGCAVCHNGPNYTNNASYDVGTGGVFQVPSLRGLASRAPYLHDGRAATLLDRFNETGGGDAHGRTTQLTPAQLADLVSYLETL